MISCDEQLANDFANQLHLSNDCLDIHPIVMEVIDRNTLTTI